MGYLKYFLVDCGCLCDDIFNAANNDAILLSVLGVRVLIEDTINVHYLASKSAEAERIAIAKDWLRVSNDPAAQKNQLDGKSVAARAKEAGEEVKALYDNEYAMFCGYTHGSAQRSLLVVDALRVLAAQKAVLASLQAYANIVTCVAGIASEVVPKKVLDGTKGYLAKYRENVSLAIFSIGDDTEQRPHTS